MTMFGCRVIKFISSTKQMVQENHLVHGDIRFLNLIFGSSASAVYIIDCDYTAPPRDRYPSTYNGALDERHPTAKANEIKAFEHDWHAFFYICRRFYLSTQKVLQALFLLSTRPVLKCHFVLINISFSCRHTHHVGTL